jgi:replication-associated recombination protein RarA
MPVRKNFAGRRRETPFSPRQIRVFTVQMLFTKTDDRKNLCGNLAALRKSLRTSAEDAALHRGENRQ